MDSNETRAAIRKLMKSEPTLTGDRVGKRVGCSMSTAYAHMKFIRDEAEAAEDAARKAEDEGAADAVRASLAGDTTKETNVTTATKTTATTKPVQGGGQRPDQGELRKLELQLDAATEREGELLNHIAILSSRLVRFMDRIDELEAAAAEGSAE